MIIDNLKIELDSIVDDNLNEESQQKKIESEINEILRNIDLSYEVVEPEFNDIELNNIELNDIEYVESEFNDYKDSNNEISFGLFSSDNYSINNIKKEEFIESGNEFVQPNEIDQDHLNNFNEVGEDEIEFIKLDLNEEVSEDLEIQDQIHVNQDNSENEIEMPENLFEKPIENDSDNENLIRRENLKQFNYVFKNKNSTIEDLEKIPAYKRMGIEINDSKSQNEDMFSKTILNEDNKLEFPDVNTYLHDNVD
mgnify:FL=1